MAQIDHLGIAVKSLTAAKSIYEKLGLSISPEETVEHEQVRLVMVPVGESRLELLEATSEDSTIAKFIAKRGEGLHHVCFAGSGFAGCHCAAEERRGRLFRRKSKLARAGINIFSCIRLVRAECCWSWCRNKVKRKTGHGFSRIGSGSL